MKIQINNYLFLSLSILYIFGNALLKVKADDCAFFEKAVNHFGNNLKVEYYNNTLPSCCSFEGVVCENIENENHITQFFDGKEADALNELSNLNYLTQLNLESFMFSKGLPPEIGKLKNLKVL
ncbi:hypothetical protein PIROE2DRAFT_17197 [Piromyces sp. E2]|nr:hypothetical protein PIROE2DRAFT_17197 [Piromyces sp. E2]|eukprot:OUM57728.1 hypothetical protein PIROE2DRAFT_17197 [Piromyces sp. E2]